MAQKKHLFIGDALYIYECCLYINTAYKFFSFPYKWTVHHYTTVQNLSANRDIVYEIVYVFLKIPLVWVYDLWRCKDENDFFLTQEKYYLIYWLSISYV